MDGVKRVLLIDDEADFRDLYSRKLINMGMMVETADDGLTGLERARIGGYDLILLDMMMPRMNGLDFLTALGTENLAGKNGPVVVLTALARDTVVTQAIKLGAIGCVTKPDVNPDQFGEQIQKFLQMSHS